jgi:glycosyltransferase involved in cell wall biosynthesis
VWGHSYVREVRESVKSILGQWAARIHWAGEVSNSEYIAIVQNSQFLVHNVLADNGTFSVIEAAALGRPAMSSDYPQMRQLNKQFGLGLHFFDAFDIDETAKVMSELEGKPIHFNSGLQERIEKFSWHSWDETVITAINSIGSAPRKEIACL